MKKIVCIIMSIIILFNNRVSISYGEDNINNEMRAAWITTVYNQDWPSNKNNSVQQKNEFIQILDDLKSLGFNTVVVQVRPKGDALYNSNINVWSDILTGSQGKNPGYDPLAFMVEEAHRRGMKIHAWFNPYRITTTGSDINSLSPDHFARKNPNLVMKYSFKKDGKMLEALCYNPGLPEVRRHIVDTVNEVVSNYDIDGVHFDDYFYPEGEYNDDDAYNLYGAGKNKSDWRRENVNLLIKEVYDSIKQTNPSVDFGVSPRGIWKNKSSDVTGSDTQGSQSYYDIYCDTRYWIKNGWIDYVTPQLYWHIGNKSADYSKLVDWWSNEVNGSKVKLYIGQGIYKDTVAEEIEEQIKLNRKYRNIKGSIYFSYRDIKINRKGIRDKLTILNEDKPIPPIGSEDKYYLEMKKFYGDSSVNHAVNTLRSEMGWYVQPEKIYQDFTKYRIVTGEFNGEFEAKNALSKLIDSTGWWATYEPTNNLGKYRIVTGEFNGEDSVRQALKQLKSDTSWWATYERTSEYNHIYDGTKFYRIITGEFNGEKNVKAALEQLINLTGWWATYEPTNNPDKYRIVTGEFRGEENTKRELDYLISNTGWWATYSDTGKFEYNYRIRTGYFPNEQSADINADIIRNRYGWYTEIKPWNE